MANAPVTKYQVMAKAIQIMTNQMRDSRNPEMKRRLREKIDYFSSFGVIDNYRMIVYSNNIILIHNDFRNYPNISLFNSGHMYIGAYDNALSLHDPQTIHIHGNGKADSGACVHGYFEGDSVTEDVVRENGKEVKFKYTGTNPYADFYKKGKRVKNDMSLPFIKRLLYNETVTQGDFVKSLLSIILIGSVLSNTKLNFLLIILGIILMYITYKRVKDLGYGGAKAVVLIFVLLCLQVVGLIILCIMPSKVTNNDEYKKFEERMNENLALAEKALKARCNTFNGSISWLLINAETLRIANSLIGGNGRTSGIPYSQPDDNHDYPDEEEERCQREEEERRRQREEEEERREEDRQRKISSLERQISYLESRISSLRSVVSRAESQASSARQQAATYISYANSAEDEYLRNDYLQSADSYYSDAAQYESEAASAESEISSLQSEVNSLQSEIYSL